MNRPSLVLLALVAACNGKPQAASTPAADSIPAAPAAAAAADTNAKAVVDSAAKPGTPAANPAAKPAQKQETGDRDIAIKPKFKIDEKTGKIDTIKRP